MLTLKGITATIVLLFFANACSKANQFRMCESNSDCADYDICYEIHDENNSTQCRYKEAWATVDKPTKKIPLETKQVNNVEVKIEQNYEKQITKEKTAIEKAREKCLEIGFKAKSENFAMCVFEITSREEKEIKERDRLAEEAKRAEYERIDREASLRESRSIQRRAVMAQEQAAMAQQEQAKQQDFANTMNLITNGIQMMNGTGAYAAPQPPVITPIFIPYR